MRPVFGTHCLLTLGPIGWPEATSLGGTGPLLLVPSGLACDCPGRHRLPQRAASVPSHSILALMGPASQPCSMAGRRPKAAHVLNDEERETLARWARRP